MTKLRVAPDLSLPLDVVTSTNALLAKRGSGKTYTASVLAEEMLKAKLPIVVVDPTGAWWGLRSSADGKGPGFPVVVFGGDHADIALNETSGEDIARFVVEQRPPGVIIDRSHMKKAEGVRFMLPFIETLYRLNREPLLGPVTIKGTDLAFIDWIIAGAESGKGARPMDHAWVRSLRDQCVTAGIPFMWKQDATPNGDKISLPVLDGRQWVEMPELITTEVTS